jgi:Ser/Thr protein kinase RdoA (MazF antagonist)
VHLDDAARLDTITSALVAGYRAERDLPEAHLQMLPALIMARLLTYLGWAHTRRETETAQLLTPFLIAGACAFAESFLSRA